jgi:hypothetical protein
VARKKRKQTRISFKRGSFRKKTRQKANQLGPSLLSILKISSVAGFVVAIGMLLMYADKKYIRPAQSKETGPLVLKDVPQWVSQELKDKIVAQAGGTTFPLTENSARIVAENLKSVAWLDETSVQTTADSIQVRARYRKPVAIIKSDLTEFYVDANQIALDYVDMPKLLSVKIEGLSLEPETPRYGQVWKNDALSAALKILYEISRLDGILRQTDIKLRKLKPLIIEIASIDVSNYQGKDSRSLPHIILYSQDNTPIHWGAEFGEWQKYLESPDEQKLAKLFNYYVEEGTLSTGNQVKFINLRDAKDKIPLPIDQY